jgi:hypothetical protein
MISVQHIVNIPGKHVRTFSGDERYPESLWQTENRIGFCQRILYILLSGYRKVGKYPKFYSAHSSSQSHFLQKKATFSAGKTRELEQGWSYYGVRLELGWS